MKCWGASSRPLSRNVFTDSWSGRTASAGSPSGAFSIPQGLDPSGGGPFGLQPSGGIYGLQPSAGTIGTQYPSFEGTPYQGTLQPGSNGLGTGGSGMSGTGTSGQVGSGSLIGPTYQGTTQLPSATPDMGVQVNPNTGTLPGSTGTTSGTGTNPSLQSPVDLSPGTGVNTGTMQPGSLQPGTPQPGASQPGTLQPGSGSGINTLPPSTGVVGGQSASLDEVGVLRDRVAVLEREVSSMRGTGGAGTSAEVAPSASVNAPAAPAVSTTITNVPGTDRAALQSASEATFEGSQVVATAVFDGRVRKVTPRHIDIVDTSDGSFYRLALNKGTKVFRGAQLDRITASQLSEGTPVRASFELTNSGAQNARYIVARPSKARASK